MGGTSYWGMAWCLIGVMFVGGCTYGMCQGDYYTMTGKLLSYGQEDSTIIMNSGGQNGGVLIPITTHEKKAFVDVGGRTIKCDIDDSEYLQKKPGEIVTIHCQGIFWNMSTIYKL